MQHPEEADVLRRVHDNPGTSVRKVASEVGCSKSTVHNILKNNDLHPFKCQKVQHLKPEDPPRRVEFCQWLEQQLDINNNFCACVLVSDEKGAGLSTTPMLPLSEVMKRNFS